MRIKKYTLSRVFRQDDLTFSRLLNRVRVGTATQIDLDWINTRVLPCPRGAPHAVQYNKRRDEINNQSLRELGGEYISLTALKGGSMLKKATIRDIKVKENCRIIITANGKRTLKNDEDEVWNNGDMGYFEGVDKYDRLIIRLDGTQGRYIRLPRFKKTTDSVKYTEEGEQIRKEIGFTSQYPIELGYAFTIHKTQGATMERIHIDTSNKPFFTYGLGYVALSRCKNIEGITLDRALTFDDLRPPPSALEFMNTEIEDEQMELAI